MRDDGGRVLERALPRRGVRVGEQRIDAEQVERRELTAA
jgi:hypothetical protein